MKNNVIGWLKNIITSPWFAVIFAGWSFVLAFIFLEAHPTYGEIMPHHWWIVLFLFLWTVSGICVFLFRSKLSLSIVGGIFILLIWLGMLLAGGIEGFFQDHSLWTSGKRMLATILISVIGVLAFTWWIFFLGRISFSDKNLTSLQQWTIGFVVLAIAGFILVHLNFFHPIAFLLLFGGTIFLWREDAWDSFRLFFTFKFSLGRSELFFGSLVLSIVILNILQTFFPFALGWDALNHSLLSVRSLIDSGILRTGIFPSLTEIPLAIGGIFGGIAFSQMTLVLWSSGLWLTCLYVGKKLSIPPVINMVLATAFFLIPAVQFQMTRDTKVDLIFLQIVLIGITFLFDRKWYMGAFVLGMSVLLKLTALWFFPGLLILIGLQTIPWQKKAISASILLTPIVLWSGINMVQHRFFPTTYDQLLEQAFKSPAQTPEFVIEEMITNSSTGFEEEVERYSHFSSNVFTVLWERLTNSNIPDTQKQYSDLGFWWLAVLPFIFLFILLHWYKIHPRDRALLLLGTSFFVGWIFMGKAVPWYGFPFLVIVLFLAGTFLSSIKHSRTVLYSVLSFSMLLGIWSRLQHIVPSAFHTSAAWATSPTPLNANELQQGFFAEEIKAANVVNKKLDSFILRIGTNTPFFIHQADTRILNDPQLDIFTQSFGDKDPQKTLQRWQENDFQFIIFDRATDSIELNSNGTLHQKVNDFEQFVKEVPLPVLFEGQRLILFEIPQN